MVRLLQIEWMKVKNYRTFWILLLITVVSIPAFNYVFYDLMNNSFPKSNGRSLLGSPFIFPYVWQTVGWNSSLLLIIPAILIITLITNEFTYKTHRQNIIDGWSRTQFITVKLVEVLILALLTTIVELATCIFFGYILNKVPYGVSIFTDIRFVGFFFIQSVSYTMIAFLMGAFIKRAGLAMGVFFIYLVIEQFVVSLLRHKYSIDGVDYLPEEVTDRLIPQPYTQKIMGVDKLRYWESHIPIYITIAAIYLIIYCAVAIWRFRKNDL